MKILLAGLVALALGCSSEAPTCDGAEVGGLDAGAQEAGGCVQVSVLNGCDAALHCGAAPSGAAWPDGTWLMAGCSFSGALPFGYEPYASEATAWCALPPWDRTFDVCPDSGSCLPPGC